MRRRHSQFSLKALLTTVLVIATFLGALRIGLAWREALIKRADAAEAERQTREQVL